ncbi:MAG: hypothetical protein AB7Q17_09700 [Phycisphaerae bacterium]
MKRGRSAKKSVRSTSAKKSVTRPASAVKRAKPAARAGAKPAPRASAAPRAAPRTRAPVAKPHAAAVRGALAPTYGGIGDAAVRKATGKGWDDWLKVLDRAGGAKMEHPAIARLLHEKHGVGDWWSQMVTVGYEQARGRRQKHEKPDGFSVSASKTIGAPLPTLYRAWEDLQTRGRWLADPAFTVRTATTNKSMRITWVDGRTSVDVNLYAKGPDRGQVTVQHERLPDAAAGERMKAYWVEQLAALQALLESPPPTK